MSDARLTITPLGGLGEIGLNSTLFHTDQGTVLIDCGLMFPEDYHLGVDVIIPRFDHLIDNQTDFRGIVLTHGHEDHIGALPWLVPHLSRPKIYGSRFTLALVENKLKEHSLCDQVNLITVEPGEQIELAGITFHFFPVSHSIIQGFALGMETPVGRMLHSGDFKIDPAAAIPGWSTDLESMRQFAKPGLKLLMADSTNVEKEGFSLSEALVAGTLEKIIATVEGRVIITLFSSNLQRIQNIFNLARQTHRKVAVSGRSLITNIELATSLGLLTPPPVLFLDAADLPPLPDNELLLLVTGAQGEPLSALSRIAGGGHRQLQIHEGDTVVMSSSSIPGNTRAVSRLIDDLYRLGAEVHYDSLSAVHASGHACREELRLLHKTVNPEYFVPVHGEYRHLVKHCRLAHECGTAQDKTILLENGEPLSFFADGSVRREDPVSVEYILVDGKGVGDVGSLVLRQRRILGEEGLVIVTMLRDAVSGEIINGPEILSRGFVFEQQLSHILDEARELVIEYTENIPPDEVDKLNDGVRSMLRRFFRASLGRDPVVLSLITVL